MLNEREAWNQRYRERSHSSRQPDPFLLRAFEHYVQVLFPHGGSALDLAGGVGRHAVWLAQKDWRVTLVDSSEVGHVEAKQNDATFASRINSPLSDLSKLTN